MGERGEDGAYGETSPKTRQTRRCSGDDEADDLKRARANGAHGQVRMGLESKLVCSGSGEAVGVARIPPEKFVGDSEFELTIDAAWRQRGDGAWGKRERRARRFNERGLW